MNFHLLISFLNVIDKTFFSNFGNSPSFEFVLNIACDRGNFNALFDVDVDKQLNTWQ